MKHYFIALFIVFILVAPTLQAHDAEQEAAYNISLSDSSIHLTQEEQNYIEKKKQIVICTDPDWMPFEKFDKDGHYIGVSADYHKIIRSLTGLQYTFLITNSWKETLDNAKVGKCDILSILNQTPERSEYLDFTEPYITSPSVFVTKENDKFINGIDDIKDKKLALVKGYMVDEIISAEHPEIKRVYAPNIIEALKMVSRGEAFATVGSLLEMSYNIRQLGMLHLKITGDAKFGYELKIGIKKGDTLLLSIMNKALKAIPKGDRDQILNKWISINYIESHDYNTIWKIVLFFMVILTIIIGRYIITSKYNKKLIALNKDLSEAKLAMQDINKDLEIKVMEETAKRVDNERLLMHQSKLAAMGEMIGAIAHQWRQPLNAVGLIVQDIEDAFLNDTVTEEYIVNNVNKTMEIVTQMSQTIDDFSNFFRPDKNAECFKVCSSLSEVSAMFLPQFKNKGITLDFTCVKNNISPLVDRVVTSFDCCDSVYVNGYPNEFKHVILNLLKNSVDALNSKDNKDKKISVEITIDSQNYMIFSIKDNGGGIDDDIKTRIFEPYFSTKGQGQGVGVGLYMSRQIINNMNGELWFDNTDDGATFYIRLKICEKPQTLSIK